MTLSDLGDLNWLAVIVATVLYFALAGPWFAEATFGPAMAALDRLGQGSRSAPRPGVLHRPARYLPGSRDRNNDAGRRYRLNQCH
jgi:hypothetical protein